MYDLIIQEGLIVDGTNCPGRKGDVGILKDRIVFMGELPRDQGEKILSAAGKVVAPGFIDIHSHSDFTLLADPQAVRHQHRRSRRQDHRAVKKNRAVAPA